MQDGLHALARSLGYNVAMLCITSFSSHAQANECDVIALDGGDIYAHQDQLSIVAAEDNGAGEGTIFMI